MSARADAPPLTGVGRPGGLSDSVELNGRYRAFPDAPLPDLDSPLAKAYAAEDMLDPTANLFALVCEGPAPPRIALMRQLKGTSGPGHLRLVDHGRCMWPSAKRHVFVAIFEKPDGGRVGYGVSMPAGEILRRIVAPIAAALEWSERHGFTHREIRPDNLFWTGPRREAVVLGECVTSPPGHDQPVAFETVENGLAHPAGRSVGTVRDDLYALGVTVLALCRNRPLLTEADPYELVTRKLEQGSAAALIGDASPPPELMPLLRGLLCDDPDQRWSPKDLAAWLDGERVLSLRPGAPPLAFRPFPLGNNQYRTARSLAVGLWRNGRVAADAIRSGQVEQWLRSSVREERTAEAIEAMRRTFSRFGRSSRRFDEALVARASLLLDPEGPIRFGGFAAMPDGLGTVAYTLAASGRPLDDFVGMLEAEVPSWLPAERTEALPGFHGWIDRMWSYIASPGLGGGVERCLYEMNPDLPCLGEVAGSGCVLSLEALLTVLEDRARTADFETSPIDAHVAAFALSQLGARRVALSAFVTRDDVKNRRPLFELALLTAVQRAAGLAPAPVLGRWMAHRVRPIIAGLHNRPLRKRIEAALERRRDSGRLGELWELFEDQRLWREDTQGFAAAQQEFRRNQAASDRLRADRATLLAAARRRGQQLAAAVALALATGITTIVLLAQLR